MGHTWSFLHLRGLPDQRVESPYDPLFGFPKGRKVREMIATQEEMDSAALNFKFRDYCAHKWIKYQACRRDVRPFYYRCANYKHMHDECQYEDWVLRMKEYEREKRLLKRQQRILAVQQAEAKRQRIEAL